jgi:hypothetical protein
MKNKKVAINEPISSKGSGCGSVGDPAPTTPLHEMGLI